MWFKNINNDLSFSLHIVAEWLRHGCSNLSLFSPAESWRWKTLDSRVFKTGSVSIIIKQSRNVPFPICEANKPRVYVIVHQSFISYTVKIIVP